MSRRKKDCNSCDFNVYKSRNAECTMNVHNILFLSFSFGIKYARNTTQNNSILSLQVYSRCPACIPFLKLVEVNLLTSSEVLMLNILWVVLCILLLYLTYFIQRKCKHFSLQIVLNILCAEHIETQFLHFP